MSVNEKREASIQMDDQKNSVSLASIVIDDRFQTRAAIDHAAIEDYIEAIRVRGRWPFPPIKVVSQFLVDGFHRVTAAKRVAADPETAVELRKSLQSIPCERVSVDLTSDNIPMLALQHALAANQTHGLRRTQADKRRSVELAVEQWSNESDRQIAILTGTTHPFVAKVRRELHVETLPPQQPVSSCDFAVEVETLPLESEPTSVPDHPLEVETLPPERKPVPIPENPMAEVETLPPASKPSSAKADLNGEVETLPPGKQRATGGSNEHSPDPDEEAKKIKSIANQHRDKLVLAIDNYGRLKQNRSEQTRLVKLVQSVSLW
jgi:hypothetical protein